MHLIRSFTVLEVCCTLSGTVKILTVPRISLYLLLVTLVVTDGAESTA